MDGTSLGKRNDKEAHLGYNEIMKTSRLLIPALVSFCFFACTPPEEDVHPKRRSSRADNLQRYMTKAQEVRALAQARSKPLVSGPLIPSGSLKEYLPKTPDHRVSQQIVTQKNTLQAAVREAASRRAGEKASVLLTQFRDDAVQAALSSQSPQELSAKLQDLTAQYSQKLSDFTQEEEAQTWSRPDAEQSRFSRQVLRDGSRRLREGIARDYGSLCAQKAEPVLQKAADDYWLALSSVPTPEDAERELTRVGDEADAAFAAVVEEYGDPLTSFSEADAAALRARLIAAHQEIEGQFEKLYGKEAVLQTRDIFEKYKNGADALVRQPGRLSHKLEQLDALGAAYREQMTALQVRLNGELERKAAAARGMPLAAAK